MKVWITLILCATTFFVSAQYPQLSKEDWRADLKYLKELVNEDYAHLFHRITKEEFNASIAQLDKDIPNLAPHEIIVGMAKIIAQFKVGHTGMPLALSRHGEQIRTNFHLLPINFYHFNDGVFVQGVHKDYEKAVGAKVLKIGNKTIEEALHAIRPVVSIENEQFFKAFSMSYLACPEVLHAQGVTSQIERVPVLFQKDGEEFTITFEIQKGVHIPSRYGFVANSTDWISSRQTGSTPLWMKDIEKFYYFEYLPESRTVYVRQSQMADDLHEPIPIFYEKVFSFVEHKEVDRFVLDLRLNFGGNNYKNKPIILGLIKSKINQKGKFFTLIGRNTFSAAQNLVNELENYTETIFIGEPTSENVNFFGDVKIENLPKSNLELRLSYFWWQDKDPRDKRLETSPEVAATLSSEDYRLNRDPVLHAALNYVKKMPKILADLKANFDSGDFEKANQIGQKYIKDPTQKNNSIYTQINTLGYEYLQKHQFAKAMAVFELNTQLYPEIVNNWDSLAEGYLTKGDLKKASFYYEKVIQMDPKGKAGDHAREMLEKIKRGH